MKLILSAAIAAIAIVGCNTNSTTTPAAENGTAPAENIEYAYHIEHPDNWEKGNLQHVATAMNALKAFETGDIATCVKSFGDTVNIEVDNYEDKLTNDSLKAMFTKWRGDYKEMTIKMDDWESVISKDKTKEYVSFWYKQIWTDNAGKTDSIECMDDMLIKDGKIVSLSEKIRHYAVKK